jgi:hypothetical protein
MESIALVLTLTALASTASAQRTVWLDTVSAGNAEPYPLRIGFTEWAELDLVNHAPQSVTVYVTMRRFDGHLNQTAAITLEQDKPYTLRLDDPKRTVPLRTVEKNVCPVLCNVLLIEPKPDTVTVSLRLCEQAGIDTLGSARILRERLVAHRAR